MHKLLAVLTLFILGTSYISAQQQTYRPKYKNPNGVELIAVYIGAEYCGPCHDPQLKSAIMQMKTILAERSAKEGWTFSVTGVATDWEVETGIAYLKGVGPFDEIIAGKNMFNHGATEYLWKDSAVPPVEPQVVLIEREVQYAGGRVVIKNNRVIDRYIGTIDIISWVSKGVPLIHK